MNIGEPWPDLEEAELRVWVMQTKLHQWAITDPDRCFDDLYNLVYDPSFLVVAWSRVRDNKGGRTAGVDGVIPRSLDANVGDVLGELRDVLKARSFVPQRVREKLIPKANGKVRRLGIPTATDRTVQASLKLVLEPIFEADFKPCSYGFRPKRRAQDAIAEIHYFGSRTYEWVFEADITEGFDEIDHVALMDRVRHRIRDKAILALVKAFLKSGILGEDGLDRRTITGTPQGHPLTVVGQHCVVRDRRALHAQVGSTRTVLDTRQGSSRRNSGHEARPLCGRLRGHDSRNARRRAGALGRSRNGARSDGLTPLGRKDEGLPYQ
jgi:RNA-directed DNA polymerase